MNKRFHIAIFASGTGSNAVNIINYFKQHDQITVSCVCYNRKNARVKESAEQLGVDTQYISKDWFEDSENWIDYMKSKNVNCIVLAGFLKLVPKEILETYKNFILNIHPALLPKYGGKGMYGMHVHNAVIENNERETGISIHKVNEKYDEGEIIFQKSFKVEPNDTPESVAKKIHQTEHKYFPKVIENYLLEKPLSDL